MSIPYPRSVSPVQHLPIPLRIVPNPHNGIEAWMQFHHHDVPRMSERELRNDLAAVESQVARDGEHGGCHWWLAERMARLRTALRTKQGVAA